MNQRYLVTAADADTYRQVRTYVLGVAQIVLESERRRFFSALGLSDAEVAHVQAMGAKVTQDRRYDLDTLVG